jgi:hypothetical protein
MMARSIALNLALNFLRLVIRSICGSGRTTILTLSRYYVTTVIWLKVVMGFVPIKKNWKAEAYHRNEVPEDGFWPDELYELTGSSYQRAVEASKELSVI